MSVIQCSNVYVMPSREPDCMTHKYLCVRPPTRHEEHSTVPRTKTQKKHYMKDPKT